MDAFPYLARIAQLLAKHRLEAVMIGNAAAALHGAPVTTIDYDFIFRKTPGNVKKLKALARELDAVLFQPSYPVSSLFRIMRDETGLQIDFMNTIDGVRSFEGIRARARQISLGSAQIHVAALTDIIKSKKACGRPRDLAVLPVLEKTLEETASIEERNSGSAQERE